MGFSRPGYWSGLPFPPPRDLPGPGMEPVSLMSPALADGFFTSELPGKPQYLNTDAYVCVCVCVLLRSKVG